MFTSEGFKRYFKNTSWLFYERVLRMIVGIFVSMWVARYLGPEQFGIFSYASSFVGLFAIVATLGLDSIVVRELVSGNNDKGKIIATTFWLKVSGAILVLFILFIAVSVASVGAFEKVLIFIIASAVVFQSFNVIDFYFQSQVMSKYTAYANLIALSVASVVKILLILSEASLVTFAYVVLFESIVLSMGFLYYFASLSKFKVENLIFNKVLAIKLIKESWPLIFSGMMVAVYMKIDQIMIMEMLGSASVGQYAIAARLSESVYFIPSIISASLFPALINAKKVSSKLYYSRLQNKFDLLVWIAISIIITTLFIKDDLINILVGNEFYESSNILVVHIFASIFSFLGIASSKWFVQEGLQKYLLYRSIWGGILNIVANYFFIQKYGAIGAAYSTVISQVFSSYVFNVFQQRTRHIFIMQSITLLAPLRYLKK
jgi:O-antigen/teichoic acid export membrane protein